MRSIEERTGRSLLAGLPHGEKLRLNQINGTVIKHWPLTLDLAAGQVRIEVDGRLAFLAGKPGSLMPGPASVAPAGSFTFTYLHEGRGGARESPQQTAFIEMHGTVDGIARGWDPQWDSTLHEAQFYVDPVSGRDTNSGRTAGEPKRTVQAALDQMNPKGGDTVLLRAGVYTDVVAFDRFSEATKETRVSRYGDELCTVSGAHVLTDFKRCSPEDFPLVGARFAKIFKTTLPPGMLTLAGIEGIGLREGDRPLVLATDQTGVSDLFLFGATELFHQADYFVIEDGKITEIRHPSVFLKYTSEQLRHAIGVVWNKNNRLGRFEVGTVLGDNGNALRPDPAPDAYVSPKPQFWKYALRNVIGAIEKGQWAFRAHADGAITLFIQPFDEASVTQGIAFAAARTGWDISTGNHIRIQGISFDDFGGAGIEEGMALGNISGRGRQNLNRQISIHNCRFARIHNPTANYGAIYFRNVEGLAMTNCTFRDSQNSGMLLAEITDLTLAGCLFENLTYSACRVFDTHGAIVAFCDMRNIARTAHANVANFYGTRKGQGIDRLLLYGLRVSGANGYLTWQGSSRVDMAFCDISPPILRKDIRSVVDQNSIRGVVPVRPGEPSFLWNNLFRHNPKELKGSGAVLVLGKPEVDVRYAVINNVIGGGGVSEPYLSETPNHPSSEIARRHNAYTKLTWWQGAKKGWRLDPSEAFFPRLSLVFGTNDGSGFRLSADSPMRNLKTHDMSWIIESVLSERYPGFDFSLDIDGRVFAWEEAKIGPFQLDWNVQIR